MQPGDVIIEVDGQPIERFEEVQQIVRFNQGTPLARWSSATDSASDHRDAAGHHHHRPVRNSTRSDCSASAAPGVEYRRSMTR